MLLSNGEITEPCGTPCFPDARSINRSSHSTSGSFTRRATFLQHDVMSYRVEIASQVEIDHVGLALQYRRADTLDRRVCGLLRPIAERTRLEIGFKDRFQDQLQCSLYHPGPDRWNGQLTNFPPFLGYFHLP